MNDFDTVTPRQGTDSLKWDIYNGRDVLPFWVADMDFMVAPPIQQALEERIKHPLYGYTLTPKELPDVVIAHLENEYNWHVDPEWIVWLPGVVTGLAISCRAFCADGDEVVVNPPIYHHFFDSHDADRQELVRVPLHKHEGRWTFDMQAMEAAFNDKTRLLMMCSPHNPVGVVFTPEELNQVAELCARHDVIMVSDEIHCDLVIDKNSKHYPTALACPAMADNIVTLMSGSKTWNIAGLNCSFAIISNPELRKRFVTSSQSMVTGVPPLAYCATLAAYRDGGPWRAELLDYLAANYAYVCEELNAIEGLVVEPIQATYLAWIDATGLRLNDTAGFFEEHGVGLSPGEQFGQSQYIRLNFACPRATLEEGLRRMKAAVASLKTD
ncbi:MalY/PatB family protein [Granulosicoccus antarcticus]|nr:PatB family C-S lyase [Granulosicoccus antarcticus]